MTMLQKGRAHVFLLAGALLITFLAGFWFLEPRTASSAYSGGQLGELEHYVHYLHEFSARRRVNTFFPNHQSIFDGVQVGFVNVGQGNLTFQRRDLVVPGRIPLVIARVHDSDGPGSADFGPGWHLSAAERIEVGGSATRLFTESGAVIEFVAAGDRFIRAKDFPSDYGEILRNAQGALVLAMRNGWTKEFSPTGDVYRLTRVSDKNGNEVLLRYADGLLSRLENGVHSVDFVRDRQGRIVEARDDLDRVVRYGYDADGLLSSVTDLGGHAWSYAYRDNSRLHEAVDPAGRENFKVWYESGGRVRRIELPSGRIEYEYDEASRVTTVRNRKDLLSRYHQNDQGITTRILNPLGEETSIVLDAARNVRQIWENGVLSHEMEYDTEHRIVARRSYTAQGEESARYYHDAASGQVSRIEFGDGRRIELTYDAQGNVVQVADGSSVKRYSHSATGDLTWIGHESPLKEFSVEYDAAGLIARVLEDGSLTTLGYDAYGNLGQVTFPDGRAARMEYDALGLRRKLEFSDGRRIEYSYDPSGNMVGIEVTRLDGSLDGQTLLLDSEYQVRKQVLADGREVELQYDRNGNLIEQKMGASVTRFEYDKLDRLTAVVKPDGQRLEYRYAPGEPSLIAQLDYETGPVASDRRDRGLAFASQGEVSWTRSEPAANGSVRFSESLGRFELSGEGNEIYLPATAVETALRKLRLVDDARPLNERERQFFAPSNLFFLPREYAAINCCPLCPVDSFVEGGSTCEPCFEPFPEEDPPNVTLNLWPNPILLRSTASADVTVDPPATVTLTITSDGTGRATFVSTGNTTMQVSGTTTVDIRGDAGSSSGEIDLTLSASSQGALLATRGFSVTTGACTAVYAGSSGEGTKSCPAQVQVADRYNISNYHSSCEFACQAVGYDGTFTPESCSAVTVGIEGSGNRGLGSTVSGNFNASDCDWHNVQILTTIRNAAGVPTDYVGGAIGLRCNSLPSGAPCP